MNLYHPDPNPFLAASSLLFLIPAVQAAWACDTVTAIADTIVVFTSVGFHLLRTDTWFWLDQAAIGGIVLNAVWRAWMDDPWFLPWIFAASTYNGFVFVQGRNYENYWLATGVHMSIHLLSALIGGGLRSRLGSACKGGV